MDRPEEKEIDGFIEYMGELRRKHDFRFRLNMEELQRGRLTEHVRLDLENDPPLPDWARNLLEVSHLSKRTRVCLMKYHNDKIRERRRAIATPRQS